MKTDWIGFKKHLDYLFEKRWNKSKTPWLGLYDVDIAKDWEETEPFYIYLCVYGAGGRGVEPWDMEARG